MLHLIQHLQEVIQPLILQLLHQTIKLLLVEVLARHIIIIPQDRADPEVGQEHIQEEIKDPERLVKETEEDLLQIMQIVVVVALVELELIRQRMV
jgi:hypothetical protein